MRTRKYKIVEVRWTDAISEDTWTAVEDLMQPPEVITIGALVKETKHFVHISNSFSCAPGDTDVAATMTIPKKMIHRFKEIKRVHCGRA